MWSKNPQRDGRIKGFFLEKTLEGNGTFKHLQRIRWIIAVRQRQSRILTSKICPSGLLHIATVKVASKQDFTGAKAPVFFIQFLNTIKKIATVKRLHTVVLKKTEKNWKKLKKGIDICLGICYIIEAAKVMGA